MIAGPFHVSFRELVLSRLWLDYLVSLPEDVIEVVVNPKDINYAIGYKSSNLNALKQIGRKITFIQDSNRAVNIFR